jgi:uncharacterized protein YheU (UPF0270 family)
MVKVPPDSLSDDALRGVIEAFVLREGTDYGHRDFSLEEKRRSVARQIAAGEAEVWFDPETGTTDVRPAGGAGTTRANRTGDDSHGE